MQNSNNNTEFKYVAYVSVSGIALPLRFESGWWREDQKAKEEVEGIMEYRLPHGLYHVSMNKQEREVQ